MNCIGEPVSWLRLERYALAELDGGATAAVRSHLDACPACRAALTSIEVDAVGLPALPARRAVIAAAKRPWWLLRRPLRARVAASPDAGFARSEKPALRVGWRWQVGGVGVALAAAAVLVLWLRPPGVEMPGRQTRIKGAGVVALTLVRDRAGVIAFDPADIAPDDRWKVQLTCGTPGRVTTDVVIYQPSGTSFPLPPQTITCGNAVAVPGAFRITDGGATICVAVSARAPDRARLARGPRSPMVCAAVSPR